MKGKEFKELVNKVDDNTDIYIRVEYKNFDSHDFEKITWQTFAGENFSQLILVVKCN